MVSFWQFFREGWHGRALLVRPSKCITGFKKFFLFWVHAGEYLEILEGKIRKCLFFSVTIFWNNSVLSERATQDNVFLLICQAAQ
jgi:hypothetical protein